MKNVLENVKKLPGNVKRIPIYLIGVFGQAKMYAAASLPELTEGAENIQAILESDAFKAISVVVMMVLAIMMIIKRDSKAALAGMAIVFFGIILLAGSSNIIDAVWPS
jgi:ABC-type multidrug transport system fused ATPase/permease subunit